MKDSLLLFYTLLGVFAAAVGAVFLFQGREVVRYWATGVAVIALVGLGFMGRKQNEDKKGSGQ